MATSSEKPTWAAICTVFCQAFDKCLQERVGTTALHWYCDVGNLCTCTGATCALCASRASLLASLWWGTEVKQRNVSYPLLSCACVLRPWMVFELCWDGPCVTFSAKKLFECGSLCPCTVVGIAHAHYFTQSMPLCLMFYFQQFYAVLFPVRQHDCCTIGSALFHPATFCQSVGNLQQVCTHPQFRLA